MGAIPIYHVAQRVINGALTLASRHVASGSLLRFNESRRPVSVKTDRKGVLNIYILDW